MAEEYYYGTFPLEDVQVICDDCLNRCEVKRGGYNNNTFILGCACGKRQMDAFNYRFTTGPSRRVLSSTFLRPSDRKPGRYYNDVAQSKILIEFDTGILLEDDEDVSFFVWATQQGEKPYAELERRAVKIMKLYDRFKHLLGAPEPTVEEVGNANATA